MHLKHPQSRRSAILSLLKERSSMSIEDFASYLRVSAETIRRDLAVLASEGLLLRTHGGAASLPTEPSRPKWDTGYWELSRLAANLITPGDVIALDSSPFGTALANQLRIQNIPNVSVVTASLAVANQVAGLSNVNLIIAGGSYRHLTFSCSGSHTLKALEAYRIQKTFFSCQGFTASDGPTENDDLEAQIKGAMIRNAGEVILAVHPSAYGRNALIPMCPLSSLNWVICLDPLPLNDHEAIQMLGIKIMLKTFSEKSARPGLP